jgi:threonyl-tRNA synthetase
VARHAGHDRPGDRQRLLLRLLSQRAVHAEDLPVIEKKMREIIARDKPFTKEVWPRDEAKRVFKEKGENFKVELVDASRPART